MADCLSELTVNNFYVYWSWVLECGVNSVDDVLDSAGDRFDSSVGVFAAFD